MCNCTVRDVTLYFRCRFCDSVMFVNTCFSALSSSPSPLSGTSFPVLPVAVSVVVGVVLIVVVVVVVICCCRRINNRKQLESSRVLISILSICLFVYLYSIFGTVIFEVLPAVCRYASSANVVMNCSVKLICRFTELRDCVCKLLMSCFANKVVIHWF